MIMKYTKFPQAAKEFLRFMMEPEQFDAWLTAAGGYIAPAAQGLRPRTHLDGRPEAHRRTATA
jgi:ABC-type glycerol-3-phosphate transport system substrate-binding protein